MLVVILLICVALILLGAAAGKPLGWIAIGLALLALLMMVVGAPTIQFR